MSTLSQILRSITLSILFGGAGMITFAAITLVRAAREKGLPIADAAMNNAPIFLNFSTIALACAVILVIAEILDFVKNKQAASKLTKARWATSLISAAAAMTFSLGIVPPMKQLLPEIRSNEEAHTKFDAFHKHSEKVFGVMMLFALASILLPAFDKPKRIS
ncbi:MAG TPA: DUF4149 domain-containing protein [Drouetiella sp.]